MTASPNGLNLHEAPRVARFGKWPLYAALAVLFLLGAALVYSVNFAHNDIGENEDKRQTPIKEEPRPLANIDGSGLATPPKKPVEAPAEIQPAPEPLVIVQKDTHADDQLRQEIEELRRRRKESFLTALSSPLAVRRENQQSKQGETAQVGAMQKNDNGLPAMPTAAGAYDPAADRDKEEFFDRAKKDNSWALNEQRTAGLGFELKTGSVVPGVMLTGINSDLPGNMIAQVSQNVFDSATGRHLLIPQGTKLYGVYDARLVYGQSRVLIAWNRLIFPDGSSMNIGAMPGADMSGMAGFNDEVNNHYLRIFGSAILMSAITGGMAYAMDSSNTNLGDDSSNGTSMQDEMTSALSNQLGQTTSRLLEKNLNIKPTLEIRPGYQFNIVVTKDMAFKQPYQAWRR